MQSDPSDDDATFDAVYPPEIRLLSRRFWTPVAVARRAAVLLRDAGARRVLDVGSGVGKFTLVAARTAPEVEWVGIEQRAHLVDFAEGARSALEIENARFAVGNATEGSWQAFDGLYFYNSFAENTFEPEERLDDRAELSMHRFAKDVLRTQRALSAAPLGTAVATFHGSSGRVPCSYEVASIERAGSGWLRLWTKKTALDDGSFFVEIGDTLERHDTPGGGSPPRG